jgi:hypothetical protein
MKSKDKRNETVELHEVPFQSQGENSSTNHTPRCEEIRLRAYEIYLERGALSGNELDDWLQAERELERAMPAKAQGLAIKGEAQ